MTYSFSNEKNINDSSVAIVKLIAGKDSHVTIQSDGQKFITVGYGDKKNVGPRQFFLLIRQIITLARSHRVVHLAIDFKSLSFPKVRMNDKEKAERVATDLGMANFEFTEYKSPPPEGWNFVERVTIFGKNTADIRKGFERGHIIADEVNKCRILANTPGGEMTPQLLAKEAEKAVKDLPIKATVLRKAEIKKLKMGGIIGVSQGSIESPRFIILEYRGGAKTKKPIVLIGKGITFDTGGISLKPSSGGIETMHMDMSGGAAVIHTVALAARLKIRKNIIGLVPAAENMPSGSSYRPGDILRMMSGKTVEVLNTDAEGRLILADALTYADRYKPQLVVDVATLTGAAVVALGERMSALFSNEARHLTTFQKAGNDVGDYAWPLPLWEEYEEDIKGNFADIQNIGKTRWGGAITDATFLHQFAKDYSWVHLDIAPRMTSIDGEHLAKGAAGAPVRLLTRVLETL